VYLVHSPSHASIKNSSQHTGCRGGGSGSEGEVDDDDEEEEEEEEE
jgi:hypothetical protein